MQSGYTKKGIFYSIFGPEDASAELIVFLHGLGSSQNFYYSLAKKLSEKYTCLLLDNEGAARSRLENSNLSTEIHAENVVSTINELSLGYRHINFIGHSMSGMTVNYIGATFSKTLMIGKLILLGPVHPFVGLIEVFQSRINAIKESRSLISIANGVAENAVGSKCSDLTKGFIRELVSNQTVEGYNANCASIIDSASKDNEYMAFYHLIDNPVLLVVGSEDKVCPWKNCTQIIAENIRDIRTVSLEGVGHWLAVEDDIGVYNAISDFLN